MQFFSLTDKGKLRANNEDYCDAKQIGGYTVLVLADGMGGANSGETASTKAIEIIFDNLNETFMKNLRLSDIPHTLSVISDKANESIYNLSLSEEAYHGMGTTLDICIAMQNNLYISHIGDSRVYKITPEGEITRLTKDHSLVEYMIDTGAITREEAANHPQKNVITRALGTAPYTEADIISRSVNKGDFILMCSDGLSNMLSEQQIAKTVLDSSSLKDGCTQLVKLANEAGGIDNITVILAQNI